jgi:hypothetical protein
MSDFGQTYWSWLYCDMCGHMWQFRYIWDRVKSGSWVCPNCKSDMFVKYRRYNSGGEILVVEET